MFILRNISNLVWGNSQDFVQVNGTFYDYSASGWRCLYNNCTATISKGSEQHSFVLTIARVVEEGEEVEKSEALSHSTEITESIKLCKEVGPLDQVAYSWNGMTEDDRINRFLFEFDARDDQLEMAELFQTTLCQCIWENSYQRPHTEGDEETISAFCGTPPKAFKVPATPQKTAVSAQTTAPSTPPKAAPQPTPVTPTPQASEPVTPPRTAPQPLPSTPVTPVQTPSALLLPTTPLAPSLPSQDIDGTEVVEVKADLYLFDEAKATFFIYEAIVKATIHNIEKKKDSIIYHMYVTKGDKVLISQQVCNEMYMHFDSKQLSVIWITKHTDKVWTWSLKFLDSESDELFKEEFSKALYETNVKMPFSKVNKTDIDWILGGFKDDIAMDDSYSEDDGLLDFDKLDFDEKESNDSEEEKEKEAEEEEEEESTEEEEGSDDESSKMNSSARNSALAVGYKYDRSFVVRGSQIGVFAHTPNKKLKFKTTIKNVKTPSGQFFSPKKVMLHQEDDALLLLHPDNRHHVYKMDLHRGDVVEEWKTAPTHAVNEILPETKYAQMTPQSTLVGINRQGFYKIDPRLSGNKQVDTQSFIYKVSTNPQLSCGATTGNGQLVLGSQKGEIRLYNSKTLGQHEEDALARLNPRAKTTLPGFGDPIKGVDVTADGKWVLATCKTYLLIIPTKLGDSTGFEKTMGKQKPIPRRLQLKREHIQQMGGEINFTTARFNVGQEMERSIVTSTGPYVITWNFRKVKQNKLDEYQIKRYNDIIVADQYKYGDDQAVIVTMPNDVTMARKTIVKELF